MSERDRGREILEALEAMSPGFRYAPKDREGEVEVRCDLPHMTEQQGKDQLRLLLDELDPGWYQSITLGYGFTFSEPDG